jgi:uncharacterized phosphosugar-binding protein
MQIDDAAVFGAAVRDHLGRVEEVNASVLDAVADLLLDTVVGDGLVYTSGSGHSIALVLETFYRAGGLACVHPLVHPGLLPLFGGRASTLLERVEGLAGSVLAQVQIGDHDLAFVFSNSGVNPFPVEIAQGLRAAGAPVVAVVSVAHMREAPMRASAKLGDLATHVVDTLVPPGDAAFDAGGQRTAGLSSLVSVFCWNLLLTRLADRARAAGVTLPLWTSANVAGGDERNQELFTRFRTRIPGMA